MASDNEDFYDDDDDTGFFGAPLDDGVDYDDDDGGGGGGGGDYDATQLLAGVEGLQLAQRPLTAAERDRRTAAVTGGGLSSLQPFQVELKGEICATATELDQMLVDGHLTLTTANNTIDASRLRYTNAEDADEAMHRLGNYQLLHSVQLDYFEHPFGQGVGMMLTLPSLKATPRDMFERAAETRTPEAPHGVFAKTIMPTKTPTVILHREVEQGTTDFCTAYPGHTVDTLRKTFVISATKDYAAIQREPIMSPLVPYYNMLAEQMGKPLIADKASAMGDPHKWQPTDAELTQKAAELCETAMAEKLAFVNVTDPAKMRVMLQPYQNRYDAARQMQVSQPISFTSLAQQLLFATPSAMALEANAIHGGRHRAKYEAYKAKAESIAKPIRIGLTFNYYAFPPQHQ